MSDPQAAVQSEFQFVSYWLERLTYTGRPPVNDDTAHHYELRLERTHTAIDGGQRRCAEVHLDVSLSFPGDANAPFELAARVAGRFEAAEGYPDGLYERMVLVNAPALLYAQLRPLSRIVLADGGHTFLLPLVNVAAMLDRSQPDSDRVDPVGSGR